jgi:DNA replication and repair protein RecF
MINSIQLNNFRSHQDAKFVLDQKLTVITGQNGSGKTNLLEAIYLVAKGNSFRVSDIDLIHEGDDWLRLEAESGSGSDGQISSKRIIKIEKKPNSHLPSKKFEINDKVSTRLKLDDVLPVVLFEPEDMRLLTGEPELRRKLIDSMIENLNPSYAETLKHYKRALVQRNRLLKSPTPAPDDQFFVWNIRLSELGSRIISARQDLIEKLSETSSETYSHISGKPEQLTLKYITKFPNTSTTQSATNLLTRLTETLDRDRLVGFTTNGPHRDDITFLLNNQPSSTTASRGETRSIVITLKKLEADLITKLTGKPPLVLFDDIYGELDATRQKNLLSLLPGCQVVVTSVTTPKVKSKTQNNIKL